MIRVNIGGKPKHAFLVKEGEVNNIVIPIEALQAIDIRRLKEIEDRAGDMMENMKDTKLDNGLSALVVYQDLLTVVPNPKAKELAAEKEVEVKDEPAEEGEKEPSKRGRTKKTG